MHLFLDLEGTVIEQWQQFPTFLPRECRKIREFLKKQEPEEIAIFSFAIHTDEEIEQFIDSIQPDLENILGCKVVQVVSVPMMQAASEAINKIRFFDVSDFIQMRGKDLAFHDWCHKHRPGDTNFLIDDVVPNRTTIDHDTNVSITTININKLS